MSIYRQNPLEMMANLNFDNIRDFLVYLHHELIFVERGLRRLAERIVLREHLGHARLFDAARYTQSWVSQEWNNHYRNLQYLTVDYRWARECVEPSPDVRGQEALLHEYVCAQGLSVTDIPSLEQIRQDHRSRSHRLGAINLHWCRWASTMDVSWEQHRFLRLSGFVEQVMTRFFMPVAENQDRLNTP